MIDRTTGEEQQQQPYQIRQIEMNMIAASFAGLGTVVGKLHRHMADMMGDKCPYEKEKLPDCDTIGQLGSGMANAWRRYQVSEHESERVVNEKNMKNMEK